MVVRASSGLALAFAIAGASMAARAEIAVSSNDAHTVTVNGQQIAAEPVVADTLSIVDLAKYPPQVAATIDVPGSVVGPPYAVAVAPDESFAIVSSATKLDSADPKKIVPDDRVSMIDLAGGPKVVQQVTAGAGATSVGISPNGSLVLVANRTEGTVSAFRLNNKKLEALDKVDLGNPKAGPSGLAFVSDRVALVSRDGDNMINVLRIDGNTITVDPRPLTTGVRPYTLAVAASGNLAAVSNMGRGDDDIDTVSLIDVSSEPFRTVETISVGMSPEGLRFSPDGKFLAVGTQEGTTKKNGSPFQTPNGRLAMYAVDGKSLRKVAEAPVGHWSQGIAFSKNGETIIVQNMVERTLAVFRFDGQKLTAGTPIAIGAGPAALGTAWR
ncbi:MAG TPA: beta-propeller fold lactonase family protein [Beijerinckiaceae bacterium]|jgi:DNA-binding beta-propeller fold protein YncE|nr:beta-propeller fold lactonase family protein [Beijerinckiaceae bacterium]